MADQTTIDFLQLHWDSDPAKLLFASRSHPDVDMPWVAQQIEGRRQARDKWPSLAQDARILYPPRLNREQASSEPLARYKRDLLSGSGLRAADLTGGMGIDSLWFASRAAQVDYVEFDPELCRTAQANFATLGADNIRCHCSDSMEWLAAQDPFDLIFIDPARRDVQGRKVAAFEDCTPNLLAHLDLLLQQGRRIVIKASPMISIPEAVRQLDGVSEVHIVALKGECKEVLFVLDREHPAPLQYHCANLESGQPTVPFLEAAEASAAEEVSYCSAPGRYLYEPNAAIMKSGCYNSMAVRYPVQKLARNTHLYTCDELLDSYPGRVFEILGEVRLAPKELCREIPDRKAHLISRNHPDSAPDLMKRLKLKEGGSLFVIATTVGSHPTGFLARRITPEVG